MNGQAYEQYKAALKREILEQLDCGRDFSDAEVRQIIDGRLCGRECAGRLDVAGRRRLGKELFASIPGAGRAAGAFGGQEHYGNHDKRS